MDSRLRQLNHHLEEPLGGVRRRVPRRIRVLFASKLDLFHCTIFLQMCMKFLHCELYHKTMWTRNETENITAHKLCLFTLLRSGPGSFRDFPVPRIGAVATGRDPPAVFRGSGLPNVTCKVQVPVRDTPFYILHFTFFQAGVTSSGGCGGGRWRGRHRS